MPVTTTETLRFACDCCGTPISGCDELCNEILTTDPLIVKFSGAGSCIDGLEIEVSTFASSPTPCSSRYGWVPLEVCTAEGDLTPAGGMEVLVTFCANHNPPCCTSIPGPGGVPVVQILALLTTAGGGSLGPSAGMKGCAPVTQGLPYTMDMCVGGVDFYSMARCICAIDGGLKARILE